MKELGAEPLIHANGYICRESFSLGDRPQNFYMIGSMGLAPAIGLGLALARPRAPVVVADGDGNLLMNLGDPRPGRRAPAGRTSSTASSTTRCTARPATSARPRARFAWTGWPRRPATGRSPAVAGADEIAAALRSALASPGPHFILVKVTIEEARRAAHPLRARAIRDRFRASLATR